jgi:hypothetical protein
LDLPPKPADSSDDLDLIGRALIRAVEGFVRKYLLTPYEAIARVVRGEA